jgi:predicted amidohydrolase
MMSSPKALLVVAWLLASIGLWLSACSGDHTDNQRPNNGGSDAGVDAAPADAGADSTDGSSDAPVRRYDPTLADRGEPPQDCTTDVVNIDQGGAATARVFVLNYRVDFDVLASQGEFREHIHELIHRQVVPCVDQTLPNVVVFPESMGLPMLLIGDKAATARQMSQTTDALTTVIQQIVDAFGYYGEAFPDAGLTNRFLLAITDTVVRVTYDTFGQLADRYDLYISVTVDLPEFEETSDPQLVAKLADPDYDEHDYAYRATSSEVYNRQILFGPDGAVVDQTLKTYVTQVELDELDLAAGDFTDIHPMSTPWGSTGVVISKPAWMPDVQDRLEDLGAEIIFQPEAFVGGWIKPVADDTPAEAVRWEPELFNLGGWNMVQRSPRATHNFVPQLTGNFFELPADGQVQIIEEAAAPSSADEFVGQRGPLAGNLFIGPWVVPDPIVDDASLSLEQRRAQLRQTGERLLPGSGDPLEGAYVEGIWAADLYTHTAGDPAQVQTHPDATYLGAAIFAASSQGTIGQRELVVSVRGDDGSTTDHHLDAAGYDVVRPSITAGTDKLHILAEVIGDGENRLLYARFDPDQEAFEADQIVDADLVGQWAFHPFVTASDDALHLSWIRRVDDANRAYYAQTSLSDPFGSLSVEAEIEPRPDNRPVLRANQWDARIAVDGSTIAATWIDFKNWQWEVLAAVSTDAGANWSDPVRVDAVIEGVEAIHSSPTIAALGGDAFVVAWTDADATRPSTRIGLRSFSLQAGDIELGQAHLLAGAAPYERWDWRPAIASHAGEAAVAYQTLLDDQWAVHFARLDTNLEPQPEEVAVAASDTIKHYPTMLLQSGSTPVVIWEESSPQQRPHSAVQIEAVNR